MSLEFGESKEKKLPSSMEKIKELYAQIQNIPEFMKRSQVIDQAFTERLEDLKSTAKVIINQFDEQKKVLLKRFDSWIMPIAQNVLENMLQDANQLKEKLEDKLDHLEETTTEDWNEHAKGWAQLYTKWHDRNAFIKKILEEVSNRSQQLIDKDIQIIKDYQIQSLAHIPFESETFKNVEKRLAQAVEEPLKKMMTLRNESKKHTSITQASEWVAQLQEKRESYFDQLLMKIDHVIKDHVHLDDKKDLASYLEIEGEIIFMERELHHINTDLSHISFEDEAEKQFILARLEGILDHIEELAEHSLPVVLNQRVEALKNGVTLALSRLE